MTDASTEERPLTNAEQPLPAGGFEVRERYRQYVLWLLFLIYVFNFVDRSILSILVQPIKLEFGLSDSQMGLLGGLAFAVLYSTLGIPIARLADRGSRVNIISISLLLWSLCTAATGLARSFLHLFVTRIAVGIGEAGCSPSAYSLISDYFEPKRRTTALATYSAGIYGGVFLGLVVSGGIAQRHGWRAAFFVVGLPGVVLALVTKLSLREPPRGLSDVASPSAVTSAPPMGRVMARIWAKRSFRHLSMAAALHAFVGYGVGAFYPAFLMRSHGMSLMQVGLRLGVVTAIGGLIGTTFGGRLADRMTNRRNDARFQLWIPSIAVVLNTPLSLAVYAATDARVVMGLILVTIALGSMYLGPTFASANRLVSAHERAVGSALLLFIVNLIGLGLGPLTAGVLSDFFRAHLLAQGMTDVQATANGLVWALRVLVSLNIWAALHFLLAARTLRDEYV